MDYTLIMPSGKIMTFYIKAVAELYQNINGGTLVTKEVLYINSKVEYNSTIE